MSHDDNSQKFDSGEASALKIYLTGEHIKSKAKRNFVNNRFAFLCGKHNDKLTLYGHDFNFGLDRQMRCGFLAGSFICSGTLSNPDKNYNLEFVSRDGVCAKKISELFAVLDINCGTVVRRNYFVSYVQEAEAISKFLKFVHANKSLLEFENVRVMKQLRNKINRNVNFEAANLNKTITAAVDKVSDINYIISQVGLNYLPDDLKQIAQYRLDFEQASLKELGEKFNPPMSKSTVCYKLNLIKKIADALRNKN